MKKMSLWEFFAVVDGYVDAHTSPENAGKAMNNDEMQALTHAVLNYESG